MPRPLQRPDPDLFRVHQPGGNRPMGRGELRSSHCRAGGRARPVPRRLAGSSSSPPPIVTGSGCRLECALCFGACLRASAEAAAVLTDHGLSALPGRPRSRRAIPLLGDDRASPGGVRRFRPLCRSAPSPRTLPHGGSPRVSAWARCSCSCSRSGRSSPRSTITYPSSVLGSATGSGSSWLSLPWSRRSRSCW